MVGRGRTGIGQRQCQDDGVEGAAVQAGGYAALRRSSRLVIRDLVEWLGIVILSRRRRSSVARQHEDGIPRYPRDDNAGVFNRIPYHPASISR